MPTFPPAVSRPAAAPDLAAWATLAVRDFLHDGPRVSMPRPHVQVVVRLGGAAVGGLDLHVMGPRQRVTRKFIRAGQRLVIARLRLGASTDVLGLPACELAGRVVPLAELWGDAATGLLRDRLAAADGTLRVAAELHGALAGRPAAGHEDRPCARLAVAAAERLPGRPVAEVAASLGVSERHLRRVFQDVVGLGPKTFARLVRFRHALDAARAPRRDNWAGIAVDAGYYDQAHLIADFRAIAGTAPGALLEELRASPGPSPGMATWGPGPQALLEAPHASAGPTSAALATGGATAPP